MLITTEGIVLHFIKYGDSSVIATIYTRSSGRQAYLLNISHSRKSKIKMGILQPLFLVNLVAYQKDSREVQRIKEIKNDPVYQNIPFEITKSSQALFLAEVLLKTLREQESAPDLFDFIRNSLLYFDLEEGSAGNFHLWFLFRLTEFLGIMPDMNKTGFEGWFDMKKGAIVPFEPSHPFFMNKEATAKLIYLSMLKLADVGQLQITRNMRGYITNKILEYYQLHFQHLGEIKSLKVLNEVFS
jgi:DNA repair protein RecO (recombination protein O)